MKESIKSFLISLICLQSILLAQSVEISSNNKISILEHAQLYLGKDDLNITDVIDKKLFKKYDKPILNIGLKKEIVWLKFSLNNTTDDEINKVLVLNSPILENIKFYTNDQLDSPILKGTAHLTQKHSTLFPIFSINLEANSSQTYYLKIKSTYSPVSFALSVEEPEQFYKYDTNQRLINTLLIGFILALMIYSLVLGFYTRNVSYFFYSLYLGVLISQQMSYLGLSQIHFPIFIASNDYYLSLFKVAGLVMTSALFAMHFLNTKELKTIHKIYKLFIIISILEIFLHYTYELIYLETVVFTSIMFIIFNLVAAIIVYKNGNKQARLFILGFGIVFLTYVMMILDSLGLSEFMQSVPNAVTYATALEALILSLAFSDQYAILHKEKVELDEQIFKELKHREEIVKNEVVQKTIELNQSLQKKKILLKELHHRVKNNLQIILSIIRLQHSDIDDEKTKKIFSTLEYRINAITSTYNMLLVENDLQEIDMQKYINTLLVDIKNGIFNHGGKIEITTDIKAFIPLKQSVYIGLIINELVTNSCKYAFGDGYGRINISLKQYSDDFVLMVEDDGKGFKDNSSSSSLGLNLIDILIKEQLEGDIEKLNNNKKNIIRFKI